MNNFENYPPLPVPIKTCLPKLPRVFTAHQLRDVQKQMAKKCWAWAIICDPEFADELNERFGPFDE